MNAADTAATATAREGDVSSELIRAIVNLVGTGPVPLGAYTAAEIFSVGVLIEFLEHEPSQEAISEAVRSLAARDLITTNPGDEYIEVRGDLGIAVAFQQRSRLVVDARLTGTEPDTPWRFLHMPQPEKVTLEVRIDALGIHFYSLRTTEDALERLLERLPDGDRGPGDADLDAALAASAKTALVTVSRWRDSGDREKTDVVLAREGEHLHVFLRDPDNPDRFKAQGIDHDALRRLLERLVAQPTSS
ncbi:MAG: hypothetical protein JOY89_13680 [Solirubrobacterales bacterium]|nr:hypothetical protein [Solirubrobacterales bacterium]